MPRRGWQDGEKTDQGHARKKVRQFDDVSAVTASQQFTPSASQWPRGNFANYYAIRKDVVSSNDDLSHDRRVESITQWLNLRKAKTKTNFAPIQRMLDIGCNSGRVTLELARHINDQPSFVMGVDVDEALIQEAQRNAWKYGYTRPKSVEQQRLDEKLAGSVGVGRTANAFASYRQHAPRKRLCLSDDGDTKGMWTAAFYTSDWVYADQLDTLQQTRLGRKSVQAAAIALEDGRGYDLIAALSITKWIHLSHYDDGLRRFFARIAYTLRPGGILIIEPQPYKSYKSLHKVTKPDSQERQNLNDMRVMPDDFSWIFSVELGLDGPYVIEERGKNGFMRDIHAYIRPPLSDDNVTRDKFDARIRQLLDRRKINDPLDSQYLDTIPWVPRDRKSCI